MSIESQGLLRPDLVASILAEASGRMYRIAESLARMGIQRVAGDLRDLAWALDQVREVNGMPLPRAEKSTAWKRDAYTSAG